jgi:hypothetical protein
VKRADNLEKWIEPLEVLSFNLRLIARVHYMILIGNSGNADIPFAVTSIGSTEVTIQPNYSISSFVRLKEENENKIHPTDQLEHLNMFQMMVSEFLYSHSNRDSIKKVCRYH